MTRLRLNLSERWRTLLLSILGITLLTLSFPPYGLPYLAWISLVPLLILIKRLSLLRAALVAVVIAFCFYSAHGWWMLSVDGIHPGNLGVQVLINALYVGLFGLFARAFHARLPRWNMVTFPAIWALIEFFKVHVGFLSCPWGILGYSQYAVLPVARVASWTGIYGVSFFIVIVNVMVAEVIAVLLSVRDRQDFRVVFSQPLRAFSWQLFILVAIFLMAAFPYKLFGLGKDVAPARLKVALVQAEIYSEEATRVRSPGAVFDNFSRLSLLAAESRPHLIVWPASSVPVRFPFDRRYVKKLSRLARETKSFLLVGSFGYTKLSAKAGEKSFANSAFLISPKGEIIGRYDKIGLLPFDEYLPLRGIIKWPSWIVSDKADALRGKELTVFRTDTTNFGVQICWENLFTGLFRKMAARGVDFMVSMTNETFIHVPTSHYQMLAMNVFRAIENRVAIIRTAPTGVSAIIAPDGRITSRVQDDRGHDVNVEGYLVGEIPLVSRRSFYNQYGDWFIYFLAVIVLGFLGALLFQYRKPDGDQPVV